MNWKLIRETGEPIKKDELKLVSAGPELNYMVGRAVFDFNIVSMEEDKDYYYESGGGDIKGFSPLPDFSGCRNALAKVMSVVNHWPTKVQSHFLDYLCNVVGIKQNDSFEMTSKLKLMSVTPEEYCRAVLITLMDYNSCLGCGKMISSTIEICPLCEARATSGNYVMLEP